MGCKPRNLRCPFVEPTNVDGVSAEQAFLTKIRSAHPDKRIPSIIWEQRGLPQGPDVRAFSPGQLCRIHLIPAAALTALNLQSKLTLLGRLASIRYRTIANYQVKAVRRRHPCIHA